MTVVKIGTCRFSAVVVVDAIAEIDVGAGVGVDDGSVVRHEEEGGGLKRSE